MQLEFPALPENSLEDLARELSLWARPGQLMLLQGDVGAGKSTFARAFIRELSGGRTDFDVPSPTFTLMQSYDVTRVPAAHIDLYRIKQPAEADELGIGDLLATHLVIIEWPENMTALDHADTLHVFLSGSGATRRVALRPEGQWAALLGRNALAKSFLDQTPYKAWRRSFFEGDASSRRYELLTQDAQRVLLMDMPQRPDGPIVKDGLPYSAIAHLAEGIDAVIAVNSHLTAQNYGAPRLFDVDRAHGFATLEYLGADVYGKMLLRGDDMAEPLKAATELLADMASRAWPRHVPIDARDAYAMPSYDLRAMLIEVDLLPSWYWPHVNKTKPSPEIVTEFETLWSNALQDIPAQAHIWTLRDFHSPNLLWLPERDGIRRVGLIDTQDAVYGHAAYDLASLLQDARVDVPAELAAQLLEHYCALRAAQGHFDRTDFLAAYALLGAQRATKILGIFARLFMRDGKPAYLKHMPRVKAHLEANLAHPALAGLKPWYAKHLRLGHE
jgi:N-acetylmuramate 1-kinase